MWLPHPQNRLARESGKNGVDDSIFGLHVPSLSLFFLKPRIVYGMYILYLSAAFFFVQTVQRISAGRDFPVETITG